MKQLLCAVSLSLLFASGALAQGTILWDESVNGSLSHFSGSPTALGSLQPGTNTIIGAVEIEPNGSIWISYEDFFTMAVPSGLSLNNVFFQVDKPNVQTWIGDTSFGSQLGTAASSPSGELLAQWGLAPLPADAYGMYVANHDAQATLSVANYRLDFLVEAVPEPGTAALALVGGATLLAWRRKHARANVGPEAGGDRR